MDQFGQGLGHRFQLSLPGGRLVGDFSLPSGSRGLEGMLATLYIFNLHQINWRRRSTAIESEWRQRRGSDEWRTLL